MEPRHACLRTRPAYIRLAIESGKKTTLAERHNLKLPLADLPYSMPFRLVYADNGDPLTAEACLAIVRLSLIISYKGTIVGR